MKTTLLTAIVTGALLSAGIQSYAQQAHILRCGHQAVMQQYEEAYPGFMKAKDAYFQEVAKSADARNKATGVVYRIPVVFHVVYNTSAQNVDDSNILSQLNVLNEAYRRRHADTSKTRGIFKPFSADAEIEFYLATTDPSGNPTTGITRTHTNITAFGDALDMMTTNSLDAVERIKIASKGGFDAWPTNRYLNIWIADMEDPLFGIFLLGYATPPMNPLPPNWQNGSFPANLIDGVVLQYQTIGKHNPYASDLMGLVSEGRTAVHEVGHYLGLRHIGGDAQTCGTSDDGIQDTPTMLQSSQTAGACPSVSANSCTVGTTDTMDMWENYMDYSNDICQSLFTHGQVALMRSIVSNQRIVLNVEDVNAAATRFTLYPNPATDMIYVDYPGKVNSYNILNVMGQTITTIPAEGAQKGEIRLTGLTPGMYILQINTAAKKLHQRFQVR